jgi:hypothetical protein
VLRYAIPGPPGTVSIHVQIPTAVTVDADVGCSTAIPVPENRGITRTSKSVNGIPGPPGPIAIDVDIPVPAIEDTDFCGDCEGKLLDRWLSVSAT